MSQAEDLDAVNQYITTTEIKTDAARKLHDDWVKWFNDLSYYNKNISSSTWDEARNRRAAFNLANATSESEKAQVHEVITTGVSTEQAKGQADKRLSSGLYDVSKPPLIPTSYKVAAATGGGAIAVLVLLKKLHII